MYQCLLFTMLIITGSQVSIDVPLSPVPVVLANFFTLLAGLVLGKKWGSLSVILYLFLGGIGLPVFAKGASGLETLFGVTGGYLWAYLLSTFLVGLICERGKHSWRKDLLALLVGVSTLFAIGLPWLKISGDFSWQQAIEYGFIPYLLGAAVKLTIALVVAQLYRRTFGSFPTINSNN